MLYEQFTFREIPQSGLVSISAGEEDLVLLEGLEEFVEYTIAVRAYNADGAGPYSDSVNASTYQDGEYLRL